MDALSQAVIRGFSLVAAVLQQNEMNRLNPESPPVVLDDAALVKRADALAGEMGVVTEPVESQVPEQHQDPDAFLQDARARAAASRKERDQVKLAMAKAMADEDSTVHEQRVTQL
jgi:hypothetical protein